MQAKHGFYRRGWGHAIGLAVALLVLSAMVMPSLASAKKTKTPIKNTYLALGDSLAFGYSSQLYNEGVVAGFENPENFEAGYANALYNLVKGEAAGVRLQNDGCPGETTSSLIGSKLAGELNKVPAIKESQEKGQSLPITGTETPPASAPNCLYQEAWNAFKAVGVGGPLHHPYGGKSQLEDALSTIKSKSVIEKQPVTTITLDIAANDELHAVKGIEKEIEGKVKAIAEHEVKVKFIEPVVLKEVQEKYVEPAVKIEIQEKYIGPAVFQKCQEKAVEKTGGAEPATEEARNECLANEGQKLGEEYAAEHATELKEKGQKLGLEYFNAHAAELTKKGEVLGFEYFQEHEAELLKKGEEIGHKYAAEHAAELAEEGEKLLGELAKGEGKYAGKGLFEQINSNINGILYALRHGSEFGSVDYTGAIAYLATYNPYGKLFKTAEEAKTFVEAHGGPTGPFAAENTGGAIHPGFNALGAAFVALVEPTVKTYGGCLTNAATYFNPGNKKEPKRLQELTNMANGTITGGKYDGPDIHATPKGYATIAKLISQGCGITALARKGHVHSHARKH